MGKIGSAIHEINHMDTLSARDQWVNQIHPLVKFVLTVLYIAVTVSFGKYDVAGVAGMFVYLAAGFILAELSFTDCVRRLWIALPFICLAGLVNPFLDPNRTEIAGYIISAGVLSMLTLIMKGVFSILAAYLLMATTSVEKLCYGLSLLRVPGVVLTQLMLTFRYITLLLSEAERIMQAYELRALGQKGIAFRVWGSLTGQLLLKSMDRANDVYDSMLLRGYDGHNFRPGQRIPCRPEDILYLCFWLAVLAVFRACPVILAVGDWIGGMSG